MLLPSLAQAQPAVKRKRTPESEGGPIFQTETETEETVNTANIHSRAMLAKLSIGCWTAHKYDKRISNEVSAQHGASADAGRYNKHLLGGKNAASKHRAVIASAAQARLVHYRETLPWTDEGWRMLPTENWMHYCEKMRAASADFSAKADGFVLEYPAMKSSARSLLNGMYKEEDYPDPSKIADLFSCKIDYAPIPARGDLRVGLKTDEIAEIESAIEERVRSGMDAAVKDAWDRMREVVSKLSERLSNPDAVFRDSLVGNVKECVDVLRRLNPTGNFEIEDMRQKIERELAAFDPQDLRDVKPLREAAAAKAQAILDSMRAVYGGA